MEQDKELNFIWVQSFLEECKYADQLWRMTLSESGRGAMDALVCGYVALKSQAYRSLEHAMQCGQLLFCFDGTTVLQGGAT